MHNAGWLEIFKKLHDIHQYLCHGKAASADSVGNVLVKETFTKFFSDTPADNIYNTDETGLLIGPFFSSRLPLKAEQGSNQ